MQVIGILGGVASGKSLVTEQLAELGAAIVDADQTAREVARLPHILAAARERWGDEIVRPDGQLDRSRLASIVFGNTPEATHERKYLEQLTHPEIAQRMRQQLDALSADSRAADVAVIDAPLLLEAELDGLCEQLIFVDAPVAVRQRRVLARGWNETELADREAAQRSLDEKRKLADAVIDNSGTQEQTREQVEQFWETLPR